MAQLVNESNGETVQIPEGDNVAGRGPLLKIVDKRVSRNHAILSLKDGQLSLCPKHVNPCFYKANGRTSYERLTKGKPQTLCNGDIFSLLPDGELSFKVVSKQTHPVVTAPSAISEEDKEVKSTSHDAPETASGKGSPKALPGKSDNSVDDMLFGDPAPSAESGTGSSPETFAGKDKDDSKEKGVDTKSVESKSVSPPKLMHSTSGTTGKKRVLPSWLSASSAAAKPAPYKPPTLSKTESKASVTKKGTKRKAPNEEADISSIPDLSSKGSIAAASLPPEKKPKKETPREKKEAKDESKTASTVEPAKKAASKHDEDTKKKPLCPYGTKCYRKNPAHFREYSHDFTAGSASEDDDVDEDSEVSSATKPVCQYGAKCYRKNPAHLREYYHPPKDKAAAAPRTRPKRSQAGKKKKSLVEGDSDDDGQPNTYDYQDSFIDDEGLSGTSSSYGDSDDSDWEAPTNTEKGYSRGDDDEEEDLNDLLAEADDFIHHKKM